MKNDKAIVFLGAMAAFLILFLLLDYSLQSMQGLELFPSSH